MKVGQCDDHPCRILTIFNRANISAVDALQQSRDYPMFLNHTPSKSPLSWSCCSVPSNSSYTSSMLHMLASLSISGFF